jgi:hypothetical protein
VAWSPLYVVSSNSQIGPGMVSGHAGTATNKNIISGSVNATDLANQAVTAAKIKAPEAWHAVAAGDGGHGLFRKPEHRHGGKPSKPPGCASSRRDF